jgi:hypothetical protein
MLYVVNLQATTVFTSHSTCTTFVTISYYCPRFLVYFFFFVRLPESNCARSYIIIGIRVVA